MTWALAGALLCAAGCDAGAAWTHFRRDPAYRPPGVLNVLVLVNARGEDVDQAAATLRDELVQRLADDGIAANVVTGPAPPPFARVIVSEWDPGSRGQRWFTGIWGDDSGQAIIVVDVDAFAAPATAPALAGRVRGYVRSGAWGGSALGAPEHAADVIADALAGRRIAH